MLQYSTAYPEAIVVGALRTVPKCLEQNPNKTGTMASVEMLQKTALFGTTHTQKDI